MSGSPQLATLVKRPPDTEEWLHEIKLDGYRLGELPVTGALLDGEAVVLNRRGKSEFEALQQSLGTPEGETLYLYGFDLLHLDGHDLVRSPLTDRKVTLEAVLEQAPAVIRYSDHVTGRGPDFFAEACGSVWRASSANGPGRRTAKDAGRTGSR